VQYEIEFSNSYIFEADAVKKLEKLRPAAARSDGNQVFGELSDYHAPTNEEGSGQTKEPEENYERLLFDRRPYLSVGSQRRKLCVNVSLKGLESSPHAEIEGCKVDN
jgi:hypothetical protein